jgi:antirestriction protein ArdC
MNYNSPVFSIITDQVIAALDQATIPWRRPWADLYPPASYLTGIPYRGCNTFLLSAITCSRGYQSPYWLTFKQIEKAGGQLRSSERHHRSATLVVWNRRLYEDKDDSTKTYIAWSVAYHNVWNWEQVEDVPERPVSGRREHTPLPELDAIFSAIPYRPSVRHGGNQAFYNPQADYIQMPPRDAFINAAHYYSTRAHEETHATGHATRLNRKGVANAQNFGSDPYAEEELVATFGQAFFCAEHALEQPDLHENLIAYTQSWGKRFRNDKTLFVTASAAAQRAVDFIHQRSYADGPASEQPIIAEPQAA